MAGSEKIVPGVSVCPFISIRLRIVLGCCERSETCATLIFAHSDDVLCGVYLW